MAEWLKAPAWKACILLKVSRVRIPFSPPTNFYDIRKKNKESFGHNGWGGSLGFADPVLGIGVAYTTNKINPTMASDQRIINLLKKFYEII